MMRNDCKALAQISRWDGEAGNAVFLVRWPENIHKNTPLLKIRQRICRIGNSKAAFADLSFRVVESRLTRNSGIPPQTLASLPSTDHEHWETWH